MILIIKLLLKMRSYISKMEISYCRVQPNYLSRTAIEAEILFAVCVIEKQALTGGKILAREDKCSKKIGAVLVQQADRRSFEASAVLTLVYFYIIMIVHKYRQSAAQSCLRTFELQVLPFGKTSGIELLNLLNCPTDRTFENRPMKKVRPCAFFIPEFCLGKTLKAIITAIRGGELGKKVPQAYRVYVEDTFLPCDAGDARCFKRRDGAVLLWCEVFRSKVFEAVVRCLCAK
ncbi:hypothetical protein HMPREF9731_00847 [Treponema denticola SP23]|uniref:hypothetical protein n=3 Tax=Treponema denticola TaxID=158 RepID=UPI0003534B2B|nr:hypothetical protein [Treponema denticola]EPF33661.1 hypothetical protein HMPREF9734_01809 [Treponema denticola SP44]EPF39789.1 hypothetical protein HMPREF9731_00847 [Treponema denticola SP23]